MSGYPSQPPSGSLWASQPKSPAKRNGTALVGMLAAQRHSPTSVQAAEQMEPCAATLRAKVLEYIRNSGEVGQTDEGCQVGLDMPGNTQRARRVELCEMGLVKDSGRTRPTKSGRQAVVWVATEGAQ